MPDELQLQRLDVAQASLAAHRVDGCPNRGQPGVMRARSSRSL
jgi:hypothetical protein